MPIRDWFRPPRQLMLVFLVVALASTAALGWLTLELLAQDRGAEEQRRANARDSVADAAVATSERALAAIDDFLDQPDAGSRLPVGAILVVVQPDGRFHTTPPGSLPYYPAPVPSVEGAGQAFAAAAKLEFGTNGRRDLSAAARAYARLAAETVGSVRAAALTALARVSRKRRAWDAALAAYERLQNLPDAVVDGLPAPLIARVGRASMFEDRHQTAALREEAARLGAGLQAGRFQITRAQYEYYADQIGHWRGTPLALDTESRARADAFDWLWQHKPGLATRGRGVIGQDAGAALVAWRIPPSGLPSAVVVGPAALHAMAAGSLPAGFGWALTDPEGRRLGGTTPPARDDTTRTAAATGLPWTLHVFPSPTAPPAVSARRTLLIFIVASVACLLVAGWYFIWRGISREIRVARLQSDFVAAVSHEFRSPLTSLRHIAELLASNRVSSEERRRRSYAVLVDETDRLGRLVEELLESGRLQAGGATFRPAPVDVADLVDGVVLAFARQLEMAADAVELSIDPHMTAVALIDREAVGRAIWNLLDNAVKYSPAGSLVRVEVSKDRSAGVVSIAVRDEGPGIPRSEQTRIFDRFARGADATSRRIRGTGLGLAMVRDITRAHGGRIGLASEPGRGSVFTLTLPLAGSRVAAGMPDEPRTPAEDEARSRPQSYDRPEVRVPRVTEL